MSLTDFDRRLTCAQNGAVLGDSKEGSLNQCVFQQDGPFGQQGRVLWLCDDHQYIVERWEEGKLSDMLAVQRGIDVTRRWCNT